MVVSEILIFVCAIFVAKYFWDNRRFYYLASKIPYSTFDFSFKGLYDYLTADPKKMYRLTVSSFYNKSDVAKTWLGPTLFIIPNNPDDVKIVFNAKECYDKPDYVKNPEIYMGSLFGHLEYWRSHRKVLNPYFGVQGLKPVIPIFNEKVKIMMKNIEKKVGKGEFNVFHDLTALTLETILKVMKYDVDIQNREAKSRDLYLKNLETLLRVHIIRIFKFWMRPEFIFKRSGEYKVFRDALSNCAMGLADDIISNAQSKMNNNDTVKQESFMEALVDPKNNFVYQEIRDEVNSVVLAAQDTSAIASSMTLLMLAFYKDIQEKVVAELYGVFGRTTEAPYIDYEKLSELKYLEMVINETMRLYPIVPFVVRQVDEEIVFSGGYIIPKNANIIVPISRIHRNEKYWGDDAQEFKPERFEKENFQKIHHYAYIPYTKGPRMCLGYRYAMMLMKIKLANFLLRYEVDTSLKEKELEFGVQITMTICQGYMISIKHRNCELID